ncbi:MAG: sugar ABC transporter ATP-binding protein, partial [Rhizobiaceae bacterium]|nr:sugar ABC transporter ATP-binding protein [Rhizobiaceae bacterium]
DDLSGIRLRNVSLDIREGEILGIVGLVGSGRSELGRTIFGLQSPYSGTVKLGGLDITGTACADAVALGIGYVPQERREGVFRGLSVGENSILADLSSVMGRFGVSVTKARRAAEKVVQELRVKTMGVDATIDTLSGGNQQKVSLGKWLRRDIRMMVLDEPTQGIDIGARTEIFHIIRQMAQTRGIGALVLDSDLDILAEHCDRVLVMVRGRVTREFKRSELSATALSHEVYGH